MEAEEDCQQAIEAREAAEAAAAELGDALAARTERIDVLFRRIGGARGRRTAREDARWAPIAIEPSTARIESTLARARCGRAERGGAR